MEKVTLDELEKCYKDGVVFKQKAERFQRLKKKDKRTNWEEQQFCKLHDELKNCLGDQVILQIRVIDFINKIENAEMKKMLTLHYLGMKPWDEVYANCNKDIAAQKEVQQFLEEAFK